MPGWLVLKALFPLALAFCISPQPRPRVPSSMAELEGLEFGKSDFVLLDEVTMEQFLANLKLRYPLPTMLLIMLTNMVPRAGRGG